MWTYQHGLATSLYKCFLKKFSGSDVYNKIMSNQLPSNLVSLQLSEELHKPIIRKFEKLKSTHIFYRQYLGC